MVVTAGVLGYEAGDLLTEKSMESTGGLLAVDALPELRDPGILIDTGRAAYNWLLTGDPDYRGAFSGSYSLSGWWNEQ